MNDSIEAHELNIEYMKGKKSRPPRESNPEPPAYWAGALTAELSFSE